MLAYMHLIIREASKFWGYGWLTYGTVFRRNHERPAARWDFINNFLHVAYIAGHDHPPILPCHHCNQTDHESNICVMASLIPRTRDTPAQMQKSRPPTPKGRRPTPCPSRLGPRREQRQIYLSRILQLHPYMCCLRRKSPSKGLPSAATRLSLPRTALGCHKTLLTIPRHIATQALPEGHTETRLS